MIGGESEEIREQGPVNRKAAEKMAKLHDALSPRRWPSCFRS